MALLNPAPCKNIQPVLVAMLMLIWFSGNAQKLTYEQKKEYLAQRNTFFEDKTTPADVKNQTHEAVTEDMLNCPEGLYRTYDDFVNKKPEALTYWLFNLKGGSARGYAGGELVFKDAAGKKVPVNMDEIWGYKDHDGHLWRIGSFKSFNGPAPMPFYVEYVSDYVEYHPMYYPTNVYFKPYEWCSGDLKSPIVRADYYHKVNKTRRDKVSRCQTDCDAHAPRGAFQWVAKCESCEQQCPDIRFVYVEAGKKYLPGAWTN